MIATPVDARLRKRCGESKELVIRAADVAIRTEFCELVSCTFPTKTSPLVRVELPLPENRGLAVVSDCRSVSRSAVDGVCPHSVQFPVYLKQTIVSRQVYDQAPRSAAREILTRMPIVALARAVTGNVGGADVQAHCVLPIWTDGSAILVRLDGSGGGAATDREPHPDWKVHASSGLPATTALRRFADVSATASVGVGCRFCFYLTPWVLGAALLSDDGLELPHRVWQREWCFGSRDAFADALERVVHALLESDPWPGGTAA